MVSIRTNQDRPASPTRSEPLLPEVSSNVTVGNLKALREALNEEAVRSGREIEDREFRRRSEPFGFD